MTIFLYSKSNFIADELKKEPEFIKSLIIKSSFPDLQNNLEKETNKSIVIHHISDFLDDAQNISLLIKNNPKLSFIGLSNNPDTLEGCRLLKIGYKSYLHALSNIDILKSAITSVLNGNIYVYPKLMEFLISNVPIENENNESLNTLTSKELDILKLVSKGFSNKKIGLELDIAEITVKKHISSLFKKLQVEDRLSLALILK